MNKLGVLENPKKPASRERSESDAVDDAIQPRLT